MLSTWNMTNLLGLFAPENHADLTTDDGKQSLLSEPAVKESNTNA